MTVTGGGAVKALAVFLREHLEPSKEAGGRRLMPPPPADPLSTTSCEVFARWGRSRSSSLRPPA